MPDGRIDFGNGVVAWLVDSRLHRTDGPAYMTADGYYAWCIRGEVMSFDDWCEQLKLDEKTRTFLRLKYG